MYPAPGAGTVILEMSSCGWWIMSTNFTPSQCGLALRRRSRPALKSRGLDGWIPSSRWRQRQRGDGAAAVSASERLKFERLSRGRMEDLGLSALLQGAPDGLEVLSYRSDDILYYLIIQLKISKILESIFIQLRITLRYKIYQMQKP